MVKYLISTSICNTKKLIKIPGLFNTQIVNRIFPFIVSLSKGNQEMFVYFLEDLGFLWDEDTFDNLFETLTKRELNEYLPLVFKSRTVQTIFYAMSYQYRFCYIEHILSAKKDLLDEINNQVL